MSTSPTAAVPTTTSINPFPEGFDRADWAWYGRYARMIEWTAGAILLGLVILIGLPFYCIIAIPVFLGCSVANLPVNEELVCLVGDWKRHWSGKFIREVAVPRLYTLAGILVFLIFPVLLTWSVSSRIDMVVNARIALVEETLKNSSKTVDDVYASMQMSQLDSCNKMAEKKRFLGDCVSYVQELGQNLTGFLEANEHHPSYQLFLTAFNTSRDIRLELAKIRSHVLPNPGILQIIFDLIPACLNSVRQQTWPVASMLATLGLLIILFEFLYRYGPWIQNRYPMVRAISVAGCLFLVAGLALLYLSFEAIVWPDVFGVIDLKYGLKQSYEQVKQRLDELQSSRGILDYYLSRVISVVICIGAFVTICLGTYITGKSSKAMYLVGFFLFFFVAEVQYACLEVALKHCSFLLFPVLISAGGLLVYDRYYGETH